MVELRLNQATGKHEVPGPNTHGRVYKVIDQTTGEIGYNCTLSDLPGLDPRHVEMIEKYDTFGGWVTEIISADDARAKTHDLNRGPREFVETKHTRLVARVIRRLSEQHAGTIDGNDVLDDMLGMYNDILDQRVRPALPGWKK